MITFLLLIYEFFKTGLFAIGGGLATIPFLEQIAKNYPWFDHNTLTNMIAIAESTPGPIGVNTATYAGFTAGYSQFGLLGGILGGIVATISIITPSVAIIVIVSHIFTKFKENQLVKDAFYTIRPATMGTITCAAIGLITSAFFPNGYNLSLELAIQLLITIVLTALLFKIKIHPIYIIITSGVLGILFRM